MNPSQASEANERIHAERGTELGGLLGRLSEYGEEEISFFGRFMYSHVPEETTIELREDPRRYLVPQTSYNGEMTIRRVYPCDNKGAYIVGSVQGFSTTFTSASNVSWQFNLEDPNKVAFGGKGNFFLSLQLSNPRGIYEVRFYSLLGKMKNMPTREKN